MNKEELEVQGLIQNSFYETADQLGFDSINEKELIEYKILIGMPIAETYEELVSMLKTNKSGPVLSKAIR